MGVRFPSVATPQTPADVTIITNAETILCTSPPLNLPLDFTQVFINWQCFIRAGTGTTIMTFILRRGNALGGIPINGGTAVDTAVPGSRTAYAGCYSDRPGAVAGQQYILTVTQTSASANGIGSDAQLLVFAL